MCKKYSFAFLLGVMLRSGTGGSRTYLVDLMNELGF